MSSIIKLKRSLTPGSAPSSLEAGELAINLPDKKIYSSNGSSVFSVSGDQYNAVTSANTETGGADILLTVDNDTLTDDRISLVGGTGTSIQRVSNGAITISVTGEGGAAQLTDARAIALAGAVSGTVNFDGSQNVTINTTVADSITANTSGTAAKATILETTRAIGGVNFDGSADINLPGVNAVGNQNTTGSAATLTTARTLGGVSFDGSANINLPGVNAAGNQDTSGTAATATLAADATKLATPRAIGGVNFDGSAAINLPGVNAAGNQDTSGNAATATALESARTLGGVSFDGTANITLPGVDAEGNQDTTGSAATLTTSRNIGGVAFDGSADINLPGVNAAGNQDTSGTAANATLAADATKLATTRAIAVAGAVSGTANFDGSAGISITTTIADSITANTSGNAATATALETARTIAISGDQVGSASFDGTGNISIATQTQANSVDLGTHTTGNYAGSVTGTANEIEITGAAGEGTNFQVGLPNDVTIGNDLTVTADLQVGGGLTVDGNLEVNGTLTYIDSTTVTIGDNMLKLANTNIADTVDTGFYVQYNDGAKKYAGLVRDASDGSFHLFDELASEPDQQINFGSSSQAVLNATIDGGTY